MRVKTRVTTVTDHDERAITLPASMHSFGVSPKTSFGTQTKEMSNVKLVMTTGNKAIFVIAFKNRWQHQQGHSNTRWL